MKEFRKSYFRDSSSAADFGARSFSVWCYRGNVVTPKWRDVDAGEKIHLNNHNVPSSVLDELILLLFLQIIT